MHCLHEARLGTGKDGSLPLSFITRNGVLLLNLTKVVAYARVISLHKKRRLSKDSQRTPIFASHRHLHQSRGDRKIRWSTFDPEDLRNTLYRPYWKQFKYVNWPHPDFTGTLRPHIKYRMNSQFYWSAITAWEHTIMFGLAAK